MRKEDIFTQDVEIPEIVQSKADIAFLEIKNGRRRNMSRKHNRMKKIIKPVIAVAACAALVVVASTANSVPKDTDTNLMSTIDNMFTLRVKAAELEKGNPVAYLSDDTSNGWAFCETEEGTVSYSIDAPFTCEGENVESITYSINKGAFQIVEPQNSSIMLRADEYNGELNVPQRGGEEKDGKTVSKVKYYTSYTVAYDEQTSDTTWINVCGERDMSDEEQELIFGKQSGNKETALFMDKVFDGVVITCTVNYEDGSSDSAEISMGGQVMTYEDAGAQAENPKDPKKKEAFVVFELK